MTWESNLRELLEKATPGAWEWVIDGFGYALIVEGAGAIFTPQAFEEGDTKPDPDSALIVALRNDAEKLVALVEAARALSEQAQMFLNSNGLALSGVRGACHDVDAALAALEGGTE